ncbi:hypothetical protein NQ318_005657 [Aromia moschata]|uniref:Uncharacterized protein n=1 Tax=Aromia moschata TaxID=1265417 RepID=A0AAV8XX80_9CUCU|nr:hypothetical protein NQ318_005657 [Aromia moschata]
MSDANLVASSEDANLVGETSVEKSVVVRCFVENVQFFDLNRSCNNSCAFRNYISEQHTAAEVKEDVSLHYRLRDSLEVTLPVNISIGPFYISVDTLRLFLINKRQEIAVKLLNMFTVRMKAAIEDVLAEYKAIMIKLVEKPESIEHILDIRDWMETVPMSIKTQEELCKRYLLEYEVLDTFWYAIPDEDFQNKWEAVGWPYKIRQQIDVTDGFLKEEEERFYKLQLDDELALQDKIETLTAQVVQMSQLRDFTKAFNGHETAQRYLQLYPNRRQSNHKLFRNLYNRLTMVLRIQSQSKKKRHFNSCFGKSRAEYSSVKYGNGAISNRLLRHLLDGQFLIGGTIICGTPRIHMLEKKDIFSMSLRRCTTHIKRTHVVYARRNATTFCLASTPIFT